MQLGMRRNGERHHSESLPGRKGEGERQRRARRIVASDKTCKIRNYTEYLGMARKLPGPADSISSWPYWSNEFSLALCHKYGRGNAPTIKYLTFYFILLFSHFFFFFKLPCFLCRAVLRR